MIDSMALVFLPTESNGSAVQQETLLQDAPKGPKHFRVLIVDDDESVRTVTSAALSDLGYQIETAEDGTAALLVIDASVPDLVITDPRMSGFELLEILRARFPQLPVVATSGEFAGDALPPGVVADAFLSKGAGLSRLRNTVAELLSISPMRVPIRPAPAQSDHPEIDGNADMMAVYGRLGAKEPASGRPIGLGFSLEIPVQARDGSQ